MKAHLQYQGKTYAVDLSLPKSIAMPLHNKIDAPTAWYVPPPKFTPVITQQFIGSVAKGGAVNFTDVFFNPHGNGTHTECVGHISETQESVYKSLQQYHCMAQLVSIYPQRQSNGDRVITVEQLQDAFDTQFLAEALIIRTLPNNDDKLHRQYANTNPPYISQEAANYLVANNIQHLLIDLPSIDREQDEGKLLAHHAFWQYPHNTRSQATITELVYIPNSIKDGSYFLQHQIAPFMLDASPSNPVIYALQEV